MFKANLPCICALSYNMIANLQAWKCKPVLSRIGHCLFFYLFFSRVANSGAHTAASLGQCSL